MRYSCALGLAALAVAMAGPAFATTYNGVSDYSTTSNPIGAWSYRDGSGNLLTSQDSTVVGEQWYNAKGFPDGAYIVANQGTVPQTSGSVFYAAQSLHLDGQDLGAEVRFTAPSTGKYSVSGQFEYGDTSMTTHTVEVVDSSGSTLFTDSLANGATKAFSLSGVSLAANAYLDFVTTNSGGPSFAGTNLQVSVSDGVATVPEPGSVAMLGLSILSLGLVRRRMA